MRAAGHVDRGVNAFEFCWQDIAATLKREDWQLRNPDFPLCVVILCPLKPSFDRYCQQQLGKSMPNLMGYYFPKTNRCMLFEVWSVPPRHDWSETERTIIHEASTNWLITLVFTSVWPIIRNGLSKVWPPFLKNPASSMRAWLPNLCRRARNPQQLPILKRMLAEPVMLERRLNQLVTNNDALNATCKVRMRFRVGLTFYLAERMSPHYGRTRSDWLP